MKSFTMKALAVAVLGLAGVGSAMAATCPTAVTTPGTTKPGGGGAWSSQLITADATLGIAGPGLNSTNCALQLSIGAASNSRSFVEDDSPTAEKRYRARFYFSPSNLSGFTSSNQGVILFRANDATAPGQFSSDQLVVRAAGGSPATIRFFVSDSNSTGTGATQVSVPLPSSPTNTYRIEFDMQVGTGTTNTSHGCDTMPASGGCFRAWVTDAATASSDTAPDASATIDNSGWGGVDTAFLGLSGGSANYRSLQKTKVVIFDEFDSRRQTFIGM